jgi:hypothetical protein
VEVPYLCWGLQCLAALNCRAGEAGRNKILAGSSLIEADSDAISTRPDEKADHCESYQKPRQHAHRLAGAGDEHVTGALRPGKFSADVGPNRREGSRRRLLNH